MRQKTSSANFASRTLFELERLLREGGVIDPVITAVLKQRKMKRTPTLLKLTLDDPRAALADFRKETLKPEDLACFSKTLDVIEGDLPHVAARANAWAVGDWPALRSGARQDWQQACELAWFNTETARKRGQTVRLVHLADLDFDGQGGGWHRSLQDRAAAGEPK